ncbi:pyridoxal-dependent decarboxylase [Brachybacterium sp. YJGR34]|uniref:pyridoxal phosphate-dependent decarboxylase family protein n=1 Tax=Brachybacterium sp. YJGR34 TaxID=2059911 RepID=UPI000E0A42F9|nr:pyridoxal-dependent decarboxylase [Brachybacterium sp. YJGR34]
MTTTTTTITPLDPAPARVGIAAPSADGALLGAHSADHYADLLHGVVDALAERFRTVDAPSVGPDRAQLAARVASTDLDGAGVGDVEALRELDDLYARNAVWFHHPAYLAHLNCPVLIPAVAAEAMLAAVNTSVDTYDQSLVGTLMERRLVEWTAGRLGYAAGDGVFTSGGTQSNLQALFLAREAVLRRHGGERAELMPRLRVLAGPAAHFSIGRAAQLLGLAPEAVQTLATTADGRVDPERLAEDLAALDAAGDIVLAVALTAGTTDQGLIDPLRPLAGICRSHGAWLHVDAAYGGALLLSERRRGLLDGIAAADSVTVDFHKTFFQPVSSSAVLVRDPASLAATSHHADYLNPAAEALGPEAEPNQVDKSLQTTRRFDALKLWATLRSVGPDRIGEMVDAVCDLAAQVHGLLEDAEDMEVLPRGDLSTVLFRFRPAGVDEEEADRLVPLIRRILMQSGRAMVARTTVDGRAWLKLTLLNPGTRVDEVTAVLDLVRATARGLLAGAALAATEETR